MGVAGVLIFWSGWNGRSILVHPGMLTLNSVSVLVWGEWVLCVSKRENTAHGFFLNNTYILFISPKGILESFFKLLATDTISS